MLGIEIIAVAKTKPHEGTRTHAGITHATVGAFKLERHPSRSTGGCDKRADIDNYPFLRGCLPQPPHSPPPPPYFSPPFT